MRFIVILFVILLFTACKKKDDYNEYVDKSLIMQSTPSVVEYSKDPICILAHATIDVEDENGNYCPPTQKACFDCSVNKK